MNIVHLIDSVDQVNYGIWNAALINSSYLKKKGHQSYAIFPEAKFEYPGITPLPFSSLNQITSLFEKHSINSKNCVIVSHGCWRWASKIGASLKKKGYPWIAVPHGMLEPWSMSQKAFKKKVYWNLFEKTYLNKADVIKAVGKPEFINLQKVFGPKIQLIHNCIDEINPSPKTWNKPLKFLFMARIHHKKGIFPLAEGWVKSTLGNNPDFELNIAGPDDGDLESLKSSIEGCSNIRYLGAIYGDDKIKLLNDNHVYVLPSYSEGFPSSVIEAMGYGLVPIISKGCNFPEAFDEKVVLQIEPNINDVLKQLEKVKTFDTDFLKSLANKAQTFVMKGYSNAAIGDKLEVLYKSVLK